MAWITNKDVHTNMELIDAFFWGRKDNGKGYLFLNYRGKGIVGIPDEYQILYNAACNATGVTPSVK